MTNGGMPYTLSPVNLWANTSRGTLNFGQVTHAHWTANGDPSGFGYSFTIAFNGATQALNLNNATVNPQNSDMIEEDFTVGTGSFHVTATIPANPANDYWGGLNVPQSLFTKVSQFNCH